MFDGGGRRQQKIFKVVNLYPASSVIVIVTTELLLSQVAGGMLGNASAGPRKTCERNPCKSGREGEG
jgi:hypothetical protein